MEAGDFEFSVITKNVNNNTQVCSTADLIQTNFTLSNANQPINNGLLIQNQALRNIITTNEYDVAELISMAGSYSVEIFINGQTFSTFNLEVSPTTASAFNTKIWGPQDILLIGEYSYFYIEVYDKYGNIRQGNNNITLSVSYFFWLLLNFFGKNKSN